jgi:hypothetical protein
MRALLVAFVVLLASAGCTDSRCNTFDGCPHDGLVGSTFAQSTDPLPDVAVTAHANATLAVAATTQSDSDGDFSLDISNGPYLLCVAAAGCPAETEMSNCCTQATPGGYASYLWEGGQWRIALP